MTYTEAEQYLFHSTPVFEQNGKDAYKPGLSITVKLDQHFGCPHHSYQTIHVAGTNGKGSVAHTLSAILQAQGYRVGLFTSPHLLTFRERIRVNGAMISEERVVRFIEDERAFFEPLHPSFFELTTALALKYFEESKVDIAVIEVGLGGRLDCTNIIEPILSIITNVSLDHTDLLGDTLTKIAREKAGIIKHGVPVVVGEMNDETAAVYQATAALMNAPLFYAPKEGVLGHAQPQSQTIRYESADYGTFYGQLTGQAQIRNTRTILTALRHLTIPIDKEAVKKGFGEVCQLTGLMGRWQCISNSPEVIVDTGHNADAWHYLAERIKAEATQRKATVILGFCSDKDVAAILKQLPHEASYIFTQAATKRAMKPEALVALAANYGINGKACPSVKEAVNEVLNNADETDFIFIGGSTFVVAECLELFIQNDGGQAD